MRRPTIALALVAAGAVALTSLLAAPRPADSQAVDVFLNVMAGGAKKLNIVIPEFTLVAGRDTQGLVKKIPDLAAPTSRSRRSSASCRGRRRSPPTTRRR